MHELSVAMRIVKALEDELAGEGEDLVVTAVSIQVGTLTGLVPEALQFSWDLATEETVLQGSEIEIRVVDAAGYCSNCQVERTLTNLQSMRCPVCRTPISQITSGNDLEILTVEIESTAHA